MNLIKIIIYIIVAFFASIVSGQSTANADLFQTIKKLDSTYFTAYNECDMAKQEKMYDEDIEFYHDMGGLSTDKKELLESIKNNICGKVTRSLVEGSIEVYPIKDYGAIEIGMHQFYNNLEPNAESEPSKFIVFWKQAGPEWHISRVVSLH
ncbi:nuclear transport factor 2 family protein [Maribacter aestuarii]|uniref:nuclear transport factor 2 family protein n=1 Tax=Maribacter aestuarii TaxID=1130723 RepID=UPI00248B0839|nr:nuclear transport factor 2 family protein [Maribacter aestuarii]